MAIKRINKISVEGVHTRSAKATTGAIFKTKIIKWAKAVAMVFGV